MFTGATGSGDRKAQAAMIDPEDILQFWFGDATNAPENAEARMSLWFDASRGVDAQIRGLFSTTVESAARGQHASWVRAPRPALAFIVLLDQFPRKHLGLGARPPALAAAPRH